MNNSFNAKNEDLNSKMTIIENNIEKISNQPLDSIQKLEQEWVSLKKQEVEIKIKQAGESSIPPFKIYENADYVK